MQRPLICICQVLLKSVITPNYNLFTYPFLPFTLWIMVPGSSTDISEDWEKDFDLDMTEEEVQMALSKVDPSGEVSGPGWPQGSKPSDPRV